jgi:type II secretory pathway component PulJ
MIVDPGDWLPLAGLGFIGACSALGVAGAWAIGRARGMRDALRENNEAAATRERIERMERSLQTVAEEIERLGEVQRFALKLIGDRVAEVEQPQNPQMQVGRVITPH